MLAFGQSLRVEQNLELAAAPRFDLELTGMSDTRVVGAAVPGRDREGVGTTLKGIAPGALARVGSTEVMFASPVFVIVTDDS